MEAGSDTGLMNDVGVMTAASADDFGEVRKSGRRELVSACVIFRVVVAGAVSGVVECGVCDAEDGCVGDGESEVGVGLGLDVVAVGSEFDMAERGAAGAVENGQCCACGPGKLEEGGSLSVVGLIANHGSLRCCCCSGDC